MKKLKDITVNLKGVDQETVDNLINFASAFANEYDVFVTDPGYDLVEEAEDTIMATTSDETPLAPTPNQFNPDRVLFDIATSLHPAVAPDSVVVHFTNLDPKQVDMLRLNNLYGFLASIYTEAVVR